MRSFLNKKKALFSTLLTLTLICFSLASCDATISTGGNNPFTQGSSDSCSGTCTTGNGVTQGLQVFVEPDAGDSVITSAIQGAQKSVWLEMYLLTDRKIIDALEEAAHNHIDVRVMLETHPYGGGSVSPTETLDRLQAAGVQTKSTNPAFALTHEKGMVIDNKTAYITTANYTLAALGSGSSTKNREYGIIDTNPQDVQSVADIFNADWNRSSFQLNDPNLVVSPINSRTSFESLIDNAHKSLQIEAEEMQDSAIEQALTKAAQRGVQVQVILPSSSGSSSESDGSDSNSQGIQTIKQGGVHVEEDSHLYMHAKIIVVDGQRAFVGSENISTASLERNRELGIIVSDQGMLNTLQQTFQQDWQSSNAV
jgi:cardiolipin synthase A/B